MGAVLDAYERRCDSGALKPDAAQRALAAKLDGLAAELKESTPSSGLFGLRRKALPPKGLYIYGEAAAARPC